MKKTLLAASALVIFCFVVVLCVRASSEAQRAKYLSDLRVTQAAVTAMIEYASHHKGQLPSSSNWEECIKPYWPREEYSEDYTVLIKEHPGDRLAMNSKLSGMNLNQILLPDNTVLLYETHSDSKDASGLPPWKQYHQCGRSTSGWLMFSFASGWACSCAEGSGIAFNKK